MIMSIKPIATDWSYLIRFKPNASKRSFDQFYNEKVELGNKDDPLSVFKDDLPISQNPSDYIQKTGLNEISVNFSFKFTRGKYSDRRGMWKFIKDQNGRVKLRVEIFGDNNNEWIVHIWKYTERKAMMNYIRNSMLVQSLHSEDEISERLIAMFGKEMMEILNTATGKSIFLPRAEKAIKKTVSELKDQVQQDQKPVKPLGDKKPLKPN